MMNRSTLYICVLLVFLGLPLPAQEIKGVVVDARSQKAIPAVNIYVKNSGIGTTSDVDGNFTLSVKSMIGILVFRHIAYETFEMSLTDIQSDLNIELVPRVIPTEGIQVESGQEPIRIVRDIPQPFRVFENEQFKARGYIDAGDLLKTEQSIQIDEEMSGAKTISMRSGNADDVIILYNGIKLNNSYDNTFDLSLLDLDDVQHIEVIKGSNSSLYGSGAFSGMINIVPKIERDYHAKFQQLFGSYNSGVWNLQLNYTLFNRLNFSYTEKRGGARRPYENAADQYLENKVRHHSAHIVYDFSRHPGENRLGVIYLQTNGDYQNTRHSESLDKLNELIGLSYSGAIGPIRHVHLVSGLQNLKSSQLIWLQPDYVDRHVKNRSFTVNLDKRVVLKNSDLLLGYQFEDAGLDFQDKRRVAADIPMGIETTQTRQQTHGFVAIGKYHAPTTSPYITAMDFDVSARHDRVNNNVSEIQQRTGDYATDLSGAQPEPTANWTKNTLKFSSRIAGEYNNFFSEAFINGGANVKFPSLYQQLSTPLTFGEGSEYIHPNLNPETNNSLELGFKTRRNLEQAGNVDGYQLQFSYFQNTFTNKFRMFYLQSIPMAFYDNVATAGISGIEFSGESFLFNHRVIVELAASRYHVSSKAAFPFKSDLKVVFNIGYNDKGSSLQLHAFFENEQIGWLRDVTGQFYQIILEGHANMDVHASQNFRIGPINTYINAGVRNLFDEDTMLDGIAIRDRRFYFTFGIQY